jgi:hypothetical protein
MNPPQKLVIARPATVPPVIPSGVRVGTAINSRRHRFEWLFRVVILLLVAASLAVAWWTFTQVFQPAQRQSRDMSARLARVAGEVDQLERKWGKAEADQVRRRYGEAYAQLFADQPALEAWLAGLRDQAAPLGLQTQIDFGQSRLAVTNEQQLAIIPASVSIEIQPLPGGDESPYQRLLRFTRQLSTEGKRADLAEMTVVGGPASVPRARLVFSLWAGEEARP